MKRSLGMKMLSLLLAVALLPIGGQDMARAAAGSAEIVQIESAMEFTAALRSDGTVWTWGQNFAGQLGSGDLDSTPRNAPAQVAGLPFIEKIAIGDHYALALDEDRQVWQWGCMVINDYEPACTGESMTVPQLVMDASGEPFIAQDIAASSEAAIALGTDATAWTWGANRLLGRGSSISYDSESTYVPGQVRTLHADGVTEQVLGNVVQVDGGAEYAMVVTGDGQLYSWGSPYNSVLGYEVSSEDMNAGIVKNARPIVFPTAGTFVTKAVTDSTAFHSLAITNNGVYGWGISSKYFGLTSANGAVITPTRIDSLDGYTITDIEVGRSHTVALLDNGTVVGTGQEGLGLNPDPIDFVPFSSAQGVEWIATGFYSTFLSTPEGIMTYGSHNLNNQGRNTYNRLGNGYYSQYENIDNLPAIMLPFEYTAPPVVAIRSYHEEGSNEFRIAFDLPPGIYDSLQMEMELDGEPEPVRKLTINRDTFYYNDNYFDSGPLEAGHYTFTIWTANAAGVQSAPEVYSVTIEPAATKLAIYLYGAQAEVDLDLGLMNYSDEEPMIAPTTVTKNTNYDFYEFMVYPGKSYELATVTESVYQFSEDYFDIKGDTIANVHVIAPDQPSDFEFGYDREGDYAFGDVRWRGPTAGEDSILEYRLYFMDATGNKIIGPQSSPLLTVPAGGLGFEGEGSYYFEYFEWEGAFPAEASYVQLFMVKESGEVAVNAKAYLAADHESMSEGTMTDAHPAHGVLQPTITFDGLPDEEGIANYVIASSRLLLKVPATGQSQYSVSLNRMRYELDEGGALSVLTESPDGYIMSQPSIIPIVDLMTGHIGAVEGERRAEYPAPASGIFVDEDPDGGQLSGNISWEDVSLDPRYRAYDLYYAMTNGTIIQGMARIYQPYGRPGILEYVIPENTIVPEGATHIAVDGRQPYDGFEHASVAPLLIPISDLETPALSSVTVNGNAASASGTEFRAEVASDVTQVQVAAISTNGLVKIGSLTPAPSVTATIPLTESPKTIPIVVSSTNGTLSTSYTLIVTRINAATPELHGIAAPVGVLSPNRTITAIAAGTTVNQLKAALARDSDIQVAVIDANGVVQQDSKLVTNQYKLRLTRGTKVTEYTLVTIKSMIGIAESEAITFAKIAAYATKTTRADVTGNGIFDKEDIRWLLNQLSK
jgi:alpha-tubulin suppressor-like RCC1 family protein